MENKRTGQRERKEKKQGSRGRGIWLGLLCAALIIGGVYLWFFVLEITPLPESIQASLYPPEITPVPVLTPEPEPTPEPTLYIPKPDVSVYTAKLTAGQDSVSGSMRLHYVNTAEDTIYAVPLHVYPNRVTPGAFTVNSLSLNGKGAYYILDGDVLTVPLAIELAPGEDCVIYMDFGIDLTAGEYGGAEQGEIQLPYLLPAAAVYENGWLMDAAPDEVAYTAPAIYSVIMEGVAQCSIPEAGPGHFYGENIQGLSVTLE